MKATSAHVALLAILMYGLLSVSYVYAQAKKSSAPGTAAASAPAQPPSFAPGAPPGAGFAFGPGAEPSPWEYRTIRLDHADAASLSQQLKKLVPSCDMVGDARTNQIIIHGTKEGIETVLSLVKQLDVPDATSPQSGVHAAIGPQPAVPIGPPLKSNLEKAWRDYAALVSNEPEVQKSVLQMLQQVEQFNSTTDEDRIKELQEHISHILGEQDRRAKENVRRAMEQCQRADEQLKRAVASSDDQQRTAAEVDRMEGQGKYQWAQNVQRAIEQLQIAMKINARIVDSVKAVADLTVDCRKLSAVENPTDDQQRELNDKKTQLKQMLSTQFDQRQKQESEELKYLRQRLDKLEEEISDRAQNRDNLINRRLDDLVSVSDGSLHSTVTLTGPAVTLEDVQGASTIQLKLDTPGAIKITRPVPPAKANAAANPSEPAMPASATVDGIQVQADSTPQPAEGAGTEDPDKQQPKAPQR
ncbi:MAG TPA: secretin N-terminal domain-containing protein [Pirellulales bacterium]